MQIDKSYSWATHVPMIQAVLKLYKPEWVLEYGIGIHSTLLFENLEYIGIENDLQWMQMMCKKFPKLDIRHHNVLPIVLSTNRNKLTEKQKLEICLYYLRLNLSKIGLGLLFIDGYLSIRTLVLNTISSKVDIIIYHDCSPTSRKYYAYEKILDEGFNRYYLTSPTSWTGILIRKEVDKGMLILKETIDPYIKEFKEKWGIIKMEMINE